MITLFCPSRGRPEAAAQLMASFLATKTSPDTELVFLVDKDDPTRSDYPTSVIFGQPTGDPTGPLNVAASSSAADIIGFCGDDSRLETGGWDRMVYRSLSTPGFAWGTDGHDIPWASTVFISRPIIKALGYMVPPTLRRGYFDVVWMELARRSGTGHVLPALFRHDNSAGDPKSPNFKAEAKVPDDVIAADAKAYDHWYINQSQADTTRVIEAAYAPFM